MNGIKDLDIFIPSCNEACLHLIVSRFNNQLKKYVKSDQVLMRKKCSSIFYSKGLSIYEVLVNFTNVFTKLPSNKDVNDLFDFVEKNCFEWTKFQFIGRNNLINLSSILYAFDLDICQIGLDIHKEMLLSTYSCKRALESNTIVNYKMNNINNDFVRRCRKYMLQYPVTILIPKNEFCGLEFWTRCDKEKCWACGNRRRYKPIPYGKGRIDCCNEFANFYHRVLHHYMTRWHVKRVNGFHKYLDRFDSLYVGDFKVDVHVVDRYDFETVNFD